MNDLYEDLNYDCNYNMFLCKTMLSNLTTLNDRQKVVRWMRKLSTCNRSVDEMRLRNDFMYYLVLNVQNGELQAPFTENPPAGALPTIAQLLPGGLDTNFDLDGNAPDMEKNAEQRRPLLYKNSPDGGAFLAAQPIPRCGAFCYLAVVSRSVTDSPTSPSGNDI